MFKKILLEFGKLMKKINGDIPLSEIDLAFMIFDADSSGCISYNEFYHTLTHIGDGKYNYLYVKFL